MFGVSDGGIQEYLDLYISVICEMGVGKVRVGVGYLKIYPSFFFQNKTSRYVDLDQAEGTLKFFRGHVRDRRKGRVGME